MIHASKVRYEIGETELLALFSSNATTQSHVGTSETKTTAGAARIGKQDEDAGDEKEHVNETRNCHRIDHCEDCSKRQH